MPLFNYTKQKKKLIIEALVASFVVAFVFAAILPKVFAVTAYYFPDVAVELDGTSDESVTISLNSPIEDGLISIQGTFDTVDTSGNFTLTSLNPAAGMVPMSNEVVDGVILWQVPPTAPVAIGERGSMWTATYNVDKNTLAGDYSLCLKGARISSESNDYNTPSYGNLCAKVTVTRSGGSSTKPTQTITFLDGESNPFTEITKYYGDDPFVVDVVTTEGEVVEYHPMDGPDDDHVVVTNPDSNTVFVGVVGEVDVCARVEETENYAETTACYKVYVQKRPLDIVGATIADKTFDGTTEATVTNVTFEDRDISDAEYTATAEFGNANAGENKGVRVRVTLIGNAADRYVLNSDIFDTTKTISPFMLTMENAELLGGTTYAYNPSGIEPEVRVTANIHGGVSTLVKGEDFNVEYSDNQAVGTGHAAVTGVKNFTTGDNPLILDFTITKKGINNSNLTVPSSLVEGRILTPNDVSVNVDGQNLVRCESAGSTDCDYVLEISGENDGVIGHTVHVAVNACNNYDGVAVADINIVAKQEQTVTIADVTDTTVNKTYGDTSFTYTATTTGDGTISYQSTNESVATVDAESGAVTIVGVGDADIVATAAETDTYAEATAKYTVSVAKKVVTVTNATVPNKVYDGTTLASVESVTLSEGSLVYNTDYTAVGMFNDSSVAIRDVQIMVFLNEDAFKNYCFMQEVSSSNPDLIIGGPVSSNVGYYSTTAAITPFTLGADNATADLTANSFVYNGSEKTPGATVKADLDGDGIKETTLTSETDYDMSYENNVNRGTGSATVSGKGNYAGSLTGLDFEIIPAPVENVVVTAPSQDYTGEALEPVPTVTGEINGSSMTFNTGDYYVIPHAEFKNAGSYTFSVKSVDGGNYYFDSTDGSFTINKVASGNPAEMTAGLKIAAGCTLAELGERTVGFAWTNPDTVVGAGNQTFPATYLQNDDSTNYTPITVDVPVYGLKRLSVVTAIMGEGGEVTNPGDLAVEEDELTWTISPDEGYELESFVINSEDKTSEVSGGRFTMIAGTDNVTATVRFRKVYEVINGAGQTHIRGVDAVAEFEIDAEYELFEDDGEVYVDGELVDSENYDSKSGSTIITLSEDYLNSLTVGEHTLAVVFADNGIARTTFIIADPEAEEDNPTAADTGVFTGATGGAIATGASVMVMGALVGAMFFAKKNRKE